MNDGFDHKVRCAAVAGWWTLLTATAVFLVQWVLYLIVVSAQPPWLLTLWGPGTTWEQVRSVWFWFLAGYKACLLLAALLLMWLTLWARQLRKG